MNVSQKCQYAIRALLELSKCYGQGPLRTSEIAEKQAVPQRFLENILNELKPTGLIESRRGVQGGYLLTKAPASISVGDIIRLIEGPLDPVKCIGDSTTPCCPLKDKCSIIHLWNRAREAVEKVYDSTSFADLVEEEKELQRSFVLNYCI